MFDQTQSLNETLLQYSRIDDVEYRLEVYYTEITEKNREWMVVEGKEQVFVDRLAEIPLEENNTQQMKDFLQNVENMNLEIQNIVTYISIDENQDFDSCLNWTITIAYSF